MITFDRLSGVSAFWYTFEGEILYEIRFLLMKQLRDALSANNCGGMFYFDPLLF